MSAPATAASAPGPMPRARRRLTLGRAAGSGTLYVGLGLIGLVLLASAVGHFVLPPPNEQNLQAPLQAPSLEHPFGTDEVGRDVLSRTLAATWLDLAFGLGVTLLAVSIGLMIGTAVGHAGGWVERATMRFVDAVLAFPSLVFVLVVIAMIGPGTTGLAVGVVGVSWAFYARFARAEMLSLRERQFIQAAQTLGYGRARIVLRHAVPNLLRPVVVYAMSDVVFTILAVASLSFLGVGVPPPTPEWGAIIESGQQYLLTAWWISTLPGLVVVVVGLGFVLVGDALSDRLGVQQEVLAQ